MNETWRPEERLFLFHGNERESGSGKRYFSRGGVKFALLELLAEENMHGYQMMKALEEQSGGTYKPSAGSVYPTLQMLRDQGFVISFKQDGKKVFQITDEGRMYLQEERDRYESSDAQDQGLEPPEQSRSEEEGEQWDGVRRRNRRLTPAGKELLHLLKAAERAAMNDGTKAAQLRALLAYLRETLRQIAAETVSGSDNANKRE
ncbi:PadR family transcriptional regulator [Paenibacillus sp. 32O-W]|uniref:PadR family transcriptional regulator n=1 Tax=Paenibacillus sp. 32O-W TaxID=1695218 RepID=UPI0007209CE5|nr:PadR family transcriptional regulator [Paenibacillus sp. 32O-W]ALS29121.1 PadR family transcriptional regulator [Paenibacillus sp. 32O-W]